LGVLFCFGVVVGVGVAKLRWEVIGGVLVGAGWLDEVRWSSEVLGLERGSCEVIRYLSTDL
jgi:hypothetical protein